MKKRKENLLIALCSYKPSAPRSAHAPVVYVVKSLLKYITDCEGNRKKLSPAVNSRKLIKKQKIYFVNQKLYYFGMEYMLSPGYIMHERTPTSPLKKLSLNALQKHFILKYVCTTRINRWLRIKMKSNVCFFLVTLTLSLLFHGDC